MKVNDQESLRLARERGLAKFLPGKLRIAVGMDTCGVGNGAEQVLEAFRKELARKKLDCYLTKTGCFGFCSHEPFVAVHVPGAPLLMLEQVAAADVPDIVAQLAKGKLPLKKALFRIEEWDHLTSVTQFGKGVTAVPLWNEVPFFRPQKKIVLRNCGLINPEDIDEYIGRRILVALQGAQADEPAAGDR
jgi:NADH-quinone oxidoreductase subunit F